MWVTLIWCHVYQAYAFCLALQPSPSSCWCGRQSAASPTCHELFENPLGCMTSVCGAGASLTSLYTSTNNLPVYQVAVDLSSVVFDITVTGGLPVRLDLCPMMSPWQPANGR